MSEDNRLVVAKIMSPIPLDAAVKIMQALGELEKERKATFRFSNEADHWLIYQEPREEAAPPAPRDPFEDWWQRNNGDSFLVSESDKPYFRTGWDAAIKWKEGK